MQNLRAHLTAFYSQVRAREGKIAAAAFACGVIVASITVASMRSAALRQARSEIKDMERRLDSTTASLMAARSAALDKEHLASQLAAEKKARGEADAKVANLRKVLAERTQPTNDSPLAARDTEQKSSGREGVNRKPGVPPLFARDQAARDPFGGLDDPHQFRVFADATQISKENIAIAESEAGGIGREFDQILGDLNRQIYGKVAEKHGITEAQVAEIMLRGTRDGWAKRIKAATKR